MSHWNLWAAGLLFAAYAATVTYINIKEKRNGKDNQ